MLKLSFDGWLILAFLVALKLVCFFEFFTPAENSSVELIVFSHYFQRLIVAPSPLYFASCSKSSDTYNWYWL